MLSCPSFSLESTAAAADSNGNSICREQQQQADSDACILNILMERTAGGSNCSFVYKMGNWLGFWRAGDTGEGGRGRVREGDGGSRGLPGSGRGPG